MYAFLVIVYVIIGVLLILSILIQPSKGSNLGGVFGGGAAQSLLGATGGKALIVKITAGLFAVFALMSLILATYRPSGTSPLQREMQKEVGQQPMLPPPPPASDQPTQPAK